jgi:molybdopterin/thiamine biosynthesis adenylyltransferase
MGLSENLISAKEIERYHRQIIIPEFGEEAQKRLKKSTVFIAGMGGLGCPAALYIAAAGVGCVRICDSGLVERSNLNRQIFYQDVDIGKSKIDAATAALKRVNPFVNVVGLSGHVTATNLKDLVADAQIIIDGIDQFETRYRINKFAVREGLPFVHAGLHSMSGLLTFIHSPDTPCLQCIFPEISPHGVFPILGAMAGIIGAFEALEALKYLGGIPHALKGKLLIVEGNPPAFHTIEVEKNPRCPVCGQAGRSDER